MIEETNPIPIEPILDHYMNYPLPEEGINLNGVIGTLEFNLITQALERTRQVKAKAAKLLRINRTTLIEKMRKYGFKLNEPMNRKKETVCQNNKSPASEESFTIKSTEHQGVSISPNPAPQSSQRF